MNKIDKPISIRLGYYEDKVNEIHDIMTQRGQDITRSQIIRMSINELYKSLKQ